MSDVSSMIIRHHVDRCPRCGREHDFALATRPRAPAELVFGGPAPREIGFICPETGKPFTEQVPAPSEDVDLVPVDPSQQHLGPPPGGETTSEREFEEWMKASRATATEFAKTLLATSTGAVPIYFATLKYLGFEQTGSTLLERSAIIPPVLFLGAAVILVLALRPWLRAISPADFPAFRARRLTYLNRFIIAGAVTFIVGVGLAVVLFFALLRGA